ncbi:hydroxyacid dehydrogenase [Ammoniphilus sp. CFH 90114]|uniref:hydroxyacid dehydrogenase n=1 Tax=Ammoniphilus sp. CFH 90114 TaxID=2493665 RepID=UPI00100E21CC|nr:hydroxyacid dehydrogenase [Ammoniphilus sp. CFH 90114]RXT07228.1 hydroxyacid dehydrogenase [Ammoniphilus sp. CFH 90114]
MKVLITEMIWPVGIDLLSQYASVEYDPTLWKNREALLNKVQDVDALIVRNQTVVDDQLLQSGKKLKVVGRLGVGLDNIDLKIAKLLKIDVVYGRNANAISVAEYVMSFMLQANRSLFHANQDVKKGNWDRMRFTGSEVYGKTLGLVGMGEIAHRVAKRASAFGMHVIGYDPFMTPYDFPSAETGIQTVSFERLLTESDFISIHVPLTRDTQSMFSTAQFQSMKHSSYLINTARGAIIDEAALVQAVQSGEIAGACLDVLETEPIQQDNPLLSCDNIVLTPHIAGLTEESQIRTSMLVAEEVIKILQGQSPLCVVR